MPSPIDGPVPTANTHCIDVLIIAGGRCELLMHPSKIPPLKEAVLSPRAGDIYSSGPIWGSLRIYKGLIYLPSLFDLRRSISAACRGNRQIRVGLLEIPVQC